MKDNGSYTRDFDFDDVWPDLRAGDKEVRRSRGSSGWILNTQPAIETTRLAAIAGPSGEGSPPSEEPEYALSELPFPVPIVSPVPYPFLEDENSVEEVFTATSAIMSPRRGECH